MFRPHPDAGEHSMRDGRKHLIHDLYFPEKSFTCVETEAPFLSPVLILFPIYSPNRIRMPPKMIIFATLTPNNRQ